MFLSGNLASITRVIWGPFTACGGELISEGPCGLDVGGRPMILVRMIEMRTPSTTAVTTRGRN